MDYYKQTAQPHMLSSDGLLTLLNRNFAQGKPVTLMVTGNSMRPFLRPQEDVVVLEPPLGRFSPGTVVLFLRDRHQMVLHRVLKETAEGLWICGDNQVRAEGPVRREQVLAVAVSVRRGDRSWDTRSLRWRFYRTVWRWMRPLRPWIGRLCRRRKNT